MVIVKPHKLYMFYGFFMPLYYVFISMSVFSFKICQEIPCDEAFCLVETNQPIRGASQVSGFYMVWVSTVQNIRADYRFCCFNIDKLSSRILQSLAGCRTMFLFAVFARQVRQSVTPIDFMSNQFLLFSANRLNQTSELNESANHFAKNSEKNM